MHVPLCAVMQSQSLSVPALFMIYYLQLHEVKLKFPRLPSVLGPQGRSQRGVQGVQLNPPSKLMIFMTIVIPWKN